MDKTIVRKTTETPVVQWLPFGNRTVYTRFNIGKTEIVYLTK